MWLCFTRVNSQSRDTLLARGGRTRRRRTQGRIALTPGLSLTNRSPQVMGHVVNGLDLKKN